MGPRSDKGVVEKGKSLALVRNRTPAAQSFALLSETSRLIIIVIITIIMTESVV
jgi:hypothetical protein